MEAGELMVGDYLRVNRDGICIPKGAIVRVTEIDSENTLRERGLKGSACCEAMDDTWLSGGIWCDYLDPIPLTPEILEKNGFRFDGSGRRSMMFISEPRFADGIRFNIYVGLKHKTIDAFAAHPVEKSPNWRKSNKVYLEVCGCYVHELQHALRLCGIEKEITL